MTAAAPAPGALGSLVRVSVQGGGRTVDLGAPGGVPVAELVPGLARTLGLLDATTVHGGFRLVRSDGTVLDSDRSLQAQSVADGAVLTLESGVGIRPARVYDDVVEAVVDAVAAQRAEWTPRDSALTAVATAVAFLLAGAVLLIGADPASPLPPAIAGAGALLVLGAAAVVSRAGNHDVGAAALAVTAAALAGVAGLTAGNTGPEWGWPAAAAGGAMLVVALIAMGAITSRREVCLAPAAFGFTVALAGVAVETTGSEAGVVLAIVNALVLTAGNGIPWLALSSTPLRVVTPRSDAEILADPPAVDPDAVREQYSRGHRTQVSLRAAVAALTLVSLPAVIGTGLAGTVLVTAGFVGMLLGVRQVYSRYDVAVVMGSGIVGLTLTGVLTAAANPEYRATLAVVAGLVAAVVIALSLISPRQRVALGRVADSIEMLVLALLLPLGVAAAGLV